MKITDLIKKNTLRNILPATPATFATYEPIVATVAKGDDQNCKFNNPVESKQELLADDSYCWPNSSSSFY